MPPKDDSADNSRPAKIRRVAAACDDCRQKKIKCDGVRPVCSPCRLRTRSTRCSWGVRKVRGVGVSHADLRRLQERVRELEESKDVVKSHQPHASTEESLEPPVPDEPVNEDDESHPQSMTLMGLTSEDQGIVTHPDKDSSAHAFTNWIKTVLDPPSKASESPATSVSASQVPYHQSKRSRTKKVHMESYVLPSRKRANYLLESYWRRAVYPFVDATTINSYYARLWTGDDLGDEGPAFLCLINLIFSMACTMDSETKSSERGAQANVFYERAREFIDLDFLNASSLLTVQCFLVLGEYLQSKNDPQGCWTFIGLAIRCAQSLELDQPVQPASIVSFHDPELSRRLWHSCVLMDRSVAMTLGRPAVITPEAAAAVPYPTAHLDGSECRCYDENCQDQVQSSDHFFVEALKLYEAMNDIWLTLYNPAAAARASPDPFSELFGIMGKRAVGVIFEMDAKLWSLTHALPQSLRPEYEAVKTPIQVRQTNILRLRHRHIRMLLFRPVLARLPVAMASTSQSLESRMPRRIALQFSICCVETALETINIFYEIASGKQLDQLDDLLPGWWYSILYIYSAASVIIAGRLHPEVVATVSEEAIVRGWESVMKILQELSNLTTDAARCAATLDMLYHKVLRHHSAQGAPEVRQPIDPSYMNNDHLPEPGSGSTFAIDHTTDLPESTIEFRPQRHTPTSRDPDDPEASGNMQMDEWGFGQSFRGADGFEAFSSHLWPDSDFMNPSDVSFDLSNMSWLTSVPPQLHGSHRS
ncbi:hypothetical protein PV10_02376 [Exophiala mesophila]|uniref:Zn(2)-C6 fungal-type domain-containing protein n=1 Tax=Exophiala mesophila TaxID=212818 RepID=A0A0D1WYS2_EXOME|nr:uncharacterized protein PV10_02376 [Exophiala mesophila]KIV94625.1 hypothetical protein PV10_02376 [Exophiala mesophila]